MNSFLMVTWIACQALVVVFMALHDWIPLGALNNLPAVRASDSRAKLFMVTFLSTLPFIVVLICTMASARGFRIGWARPAALIAYAMLIAGIARAWWIPYFFSTSPKRRARYVLRFRGTHAFVPERNGVRPDTLHVSFHIVALVTFALCFIAPARIAG
jgi:hypothetical protein